MLWLGESGHATFDETGKMLRLVGMSADITERKLAEEELAKMGGRLIHAQEEERTKIAWEIHEDVCQQLSLLGMGLDELEGAPLKSRAEIRMRTNKLRKHLLEILRDLRALSHDLHPPILDLLPLNTALRSLCNEFGKRHSVNVDYTEKNVSNPLSKEISICLFRSFKKLYVTALSTAKRITFRCNCLELLVPFNFLSAMQAWALNLSPQ